MLCNIFCDGAFLNFEQHTVSFGRRGPAIALIGFRHESVPAKPRMKSWADVERHKTCMLGSQLARSMIRAATGSNPVSWRETEHVSGRGFSRCSYRLLAQPEKRVGNHVFRRCCVVVGQWPKRRSGPLRRTIPIRLWRIAGEGDHHLRQEGYPLFDYLQSYAVGLL